MSIYSISRRSSGSAFQRVGPARGNERRPHRSRLCRGTVSSARSEDRKQVFYTICATSPATSTDAVVLPSCFVDPAALFAERLLPPSAGPSPVGASNGQWGSTGSRCRSRDAMSRASAVVRPACILAMWNLL